MASCLLVSNSRKVRDPPSHPDLVSLTPLQSAGVVTLSTMPEPKLLATVSATCRAVAMLRAFLMWLYPHASLLTFLCPQPCLWWSKSVSLQGMIGIRAFLIGYLETHCTLRSLTSLSIPCRPPRPRTSLAVSNMRVAMGKLKPL